MNDLRLQLLVGDLSMYETIDESPSLSTIAAPFITYSNDFFLRTILLANVRSVISKVDELEVVADINDADVICLTQSWLNPCFLDSTISLSNFMLFRKDRTFSSGGVVCAYLKTEIHCRRLEKSNTLLLNPFCY